MTAPAPPFVPHAELVMRAWLLGIPGVPGAAAELPADQDSWAERGFVTYLGLGGAPGLYSPMRRPVFQLDFWAINVSSGKAPWGKANQLAEIVRAATVQPAGAAWGIRGVSLGANYRTARITEATALTEPRRVFDDQGAAARYTFDLRLAFVEVES